MPGIEDVYEQDVSAVPPEDRITFEEHDTEIGEVVDVVRVIVPEKPKRLAKVTGPMIELPATNETEDEAIL